MSQITVYFVIYLVEFIIPPFFDVLFYPANQMAVSLLSPYKYNSSFYNGVVQTAPLGCLTRQVVRLPPTCLWTAWTECLSIIIVTIENRSIRRNFIAYLVRSGFIPRVQAANWRTILDRNQLNRNSRGRHVELVDAPESTNNSRFKSSIFCDDRFT